MVTILPLTVAEVVVPWGSRCPREIPLYLLEEDSVSDLEDELQSNVESKSGSGGGGSRPDPVKTAGKIHL